jgi:hypothetical protein
VGALLATIRAAVSEDRYLVGLHAYDRMRQRGILEWQVVAGLEDGRLEAERPDGHPNPVVEVCELLPDGTEFKAVWSLLPDGWAKLVTVYFYD